jgi:hypothetical protein
MGQLSLSWALRMMVSLGAQSICRIALLGGYGAETGAGCAGSVLPIAARRTSSVFENSVERFILVLENPRKIENEDKNRAGAFQICSKARNHIRPAPTIGAASFIVMGELCLLRARLSWTFVPGFWTFTARCAG